MKFSKFKTPVVGLMLISVLSLNFVNPLASTNLTDMKGTAKQIPVSGSNSAGTAIAPALLVVYAVASLSVYLATKAAYSTGNRDLPSDSYLYDGVAEIDGNSLAMNKLD